MYLAYIALSKTSFRVIISKNRNNEGNVLDANVFSGRGRARERENKKQMCFLQDAKVAGLYVRGQK